MKEKSDIIKGFIEAEKFKVKIKNNNRELEHKGKGEKIKIFELEDNLDDIWFSLWNGI